MTANETGLHDVPIEVIERNYALMNDAISNVRPQIWFIKRLKRGIVYHAKGVL
jgi:hypothetical protein